MKQPIQPFTHLSGNIRPSAVLNVFSFCLLLLASLLLTSVSKAQTALFTADDTAGCKNIIVRFTNTSTGATSYSWDLGNGNTSTLKDAAGTYTAVGTYTVTLTAFSSSGGSSKYSMLIRVYDDPVVNFNSVNKAVCPGSPVVFTNTSVANCWGTLSYKWNFGEGGSATTATPTYNYVSPGSFNVTLLATNNAGCVSSLSKPAYIFVYTTAVVGFTATNPYICHVPGTTSFSSSSTGTAPLAYSWVFGDGGTGAGATPAHSYTVPAKGYDVTLRVTDGHGCTDSIVRTALISTGSLNAGFTAPTDSCLYKPVTFYNSSTTHISSKWYFGDGGTSTLDTPKHSYSTPGVYAVKLVVYDGVCRDSITKTISIKKPTGSFKITPAGPCMPPVPITLAATVPSGTTLKWNSVLFGSIGTANPLSYNVAPYSTLPNVGQIDAFNMVITDVYGCKDTLPYVIDTFNGLGASVNALPRKGCIPVTVSFTSTIANSVYTPFGSYPPDNLIGFPYPYSIISYVWDFGDGSPFSSSPAPSHTYTSVGVFPVKCTMLTANGCTSVGYDTVRAGTSPPTSFFTSSPNRICAHNSITYTAFPSGTYTEYSWVFDEGEQSQDSMTVHVYNKPGIHKTDLTVLNTGCSNLLSTYTRYDTVDSPGAYIAFKYNCIPANGLTFTDSSEGADTRLWSFGDGGTSTLANPVHNYPSLSVYNVTLSTFNIASGCHNSVTKKVTLERLNPFLAASRAAVCKDDLDTVVATFKTVKDPNSTSPDAFPLTYALWGDWYINRALTATDTPGFYGRGYNNMSDTFRAPYHRFGIDTTTFIVHDSHGCLDTAFTRITAAKPTVTFSSSPLGVCAPLPVTFTDLTTDAPGITFATRAWSFGDDSVITVTGASVVHKYLVSGPYSVKEIVTDNVGCVDSTTITINPTINIPRASFTCNNPVYCVGLPVGFSNSSTGGTAFLWKFGDGSTSTVATPPPHIYTASGTYDVTLIMTNIITGCKDTSFQPGAVVINVVPKAAFIMDDSFAVCPPLVVNFTNKSTGATSYQWSFGDGANSAGTSPSDIYTAIGLYKVKLLAANQFGCTDTAVHYASIFGYAGAFTYTPKNICTSSPVHFKAMFSGVDSISWDFSEGSVSPLLLADTISHIYTKAGYYIPKLILRDNAGCRSVSTGIDTIKVDTLRAGFKVIPDSSCKDNSVAFTDTSFSLSSPITSWLWKFGNGATSTANNPAYTYSLSGTYTATLTVTNGTGCTGTATKNIKVNPSPAAILGTASVCIGQQTTLSDAVSGGKWSSNNTSVATIDPVTGVMNGIASGSAVISYTLPTGCYATVTATVNPLPAPITISGGGPYRLCEGFTNTFLNATTGGAWSVANTSVARLVTLGTGVVAGITAGTTPIYYTLTTGCAATVTVTVDQSPGVISGPSGVCIGSAIVLTNTIAGGAWTSSNSSLASIGSTSGVVTGVASGVVVIDYSLPTGCTQTKIITVNPPLPPITSVTGSMNVCVGASITLTNASTGGTWATANTAIATITFGSGKVTGIAPGTTTISYTSTDGCIGTTTVTVNTSPTAIGGNRQVCIGATATLSDTDPVGTWTTATTTVVSVGSGTGIVTGIKSSTGTITYTITTGCSTTAVVTVNPLPRPIFLTTFTVCEGLTTNIGDPDLGGSWTSGNTNIFTVAPSGLSSAIVTGVSAGTAVVTYTLPTTGCATTKVLTVVALKPPFAAVTDMCAGSSITLTDTGSGAWTSGNVVVATVGSGTGVVTGNSAGTAVVTYSVSSGCRATIVVTVNPIPPAISGLAGICVNDTRTLADAVPGGSWSSSLPSIAAVGSTSGVVTGMSAGTATITYMMPTGCFTTATVVINPLPGVITGNTSLCAEHATTLSDGPAGGIWSSANTTIVFVEPVTGVVMGNNAGTATITYTLGTGCKATVVVTVHSLPAAIIASSDHLCLGDTALVSDATTGGVWTSSDASVAIVSSGGLVSGVKAGAVTISYQLATTCVSTMSFTVDPMPSAISGPSFLCYGGTAALGNTVTGGTWSSADASVVSVNDTGLVSGISVGTTTITYTTTGNCTAVTTVTVYPTLYPLKGDTALCVGSTDTLYESTPGGLWSSNNTAVATIDASGGITGKAAGRTHIVYTLANSCGTAETDVEVFPLPYAGAIKGDTSVCTHGTIQLTDSIKGGVWMSLNDKLATVDTFGVVTGVAPGVDTVFYIYSNRCGADIARLAITVSQAAENAHIIIHPDSLLCSNTLYMNFGADSPEPKGGRYVWSAENAIVYAVAKNKQNCLISFPGVGVSTIRLSSQTQFSDCMSEEKLTFNISSEVSSYPEVIYYAPEFVCKDHTVDSFRWGYDDVVTLDSTLIPGAVNQNYYEPSPDFTYKNYWVLTYHQGCMQKSYYNMPTLVNSAGADGVDIKLYPNPADATVNIMVSGINRSDIIGYRLVDILGKERATGDLVDGKGSIRLSGTVPGVYMVLFTRNGVSIGTKVFVKN